MRRLAAILVLLWVGLSSVAAQTLTPDAPWWTQTTGPAYQVLVYSYADSDQDGWGDFKGLQHRLDAIASLGVQTLWLSPIHPSASYHGYDVTNYLDVDPKYGTLDDFDQLVAAAHKRGLHIVLDMVFNHTSVAHPWYQAFLKDAKSPYRDYYVWKRPGITYGGTTMGGWSRTAIDGLQVFSAFPGSMMDLDNANPAVVSEEHNILKFWLERGVDGFRFDAAKEVFNSGEMPVGSSALALNRKYWNELRDYSRTINPGVLFLGEVSNRDARETKSYATAFDSLFDFAGAYQLSTFPAAGNETRLAANLVQAYKLYQGVSGFLPAPFLTNHDQDRTMSLNLATVGLANAKGWGPEIVDDDRSLQAKDRALGRARVQAAMYLTLPGMPYIYYGEELGLVGRKYANNDVARRDAMPWGDEDPSGDTAIWAKDTGQLEPNQNRATPTWSAQDGDPQSLLELYRAWGNFRKAHPVLTTAPLTLPDAKTWKGLNSGTLVAWLRGDLLLTANLGTKSQEFTVPAGRALEPLLSTGDAPEVSQSQTLPPLSATIWAMK
ncbi:MAG: alpha-amylase family glycosyl hydrolase [Spirochaetales bacterium]